MQATKEERYQPSSTIHPHLFLTTRYGIHSSTTAELNERTLRIALTIIDELILNRDVPKLSSVVMIRQHPKRVAKNRFKLGEASVMMKKKLVM